MRSNLIGIHQATRQVIYHYQVTTILDFPGQTCHPENTDIGISGCPVPFHNKETKLGRSDHEASPSAGKSMSLQLFLVM